MPVLRLQMDEKVRIGDNVVLTIVHLSPQDVRIAIEAPNDVTIWRDERGEWSEAKRPRNAIEAAKGVGDNVSDGIFDDRDCKPTAPCDARPGSDEKIAELARRVEQGESLWSERDGHRRLKTSKDIATWVKTDLATATDDRRTWKLKYDVVLTKPGQLVYVDRVGVVESAIMLHDAETDKWFAAQEVLEPLTSSVWQRIRAMINGDTDYGREVRSV